MKKLTLTAIAFTIIFGVQLLIPNQSEAGVSCKYDFYGNYVCKETGFNSFGSGNSSSTRKDFYGNDVTTFKNGYGQSTGTMSCKTDFYGNYVCN
jgi:hypothetical protein